MHVRDGVIVAVGQKLNAPGATHHQRARHDRAAGSGRDALAHVEHAAAQHVRREARVRLFPHHRGARAAIRSPPICTRARGLRRPKRSTPASPSCTTGATTSAARDYARGRSAALQESGLRGALLLRRRAGHAESPGRSTSPISRRLARDWPSYSNDGLITLGLAWRGMGGNNPATAIPAEIYKAEIERRAQARTADLGPRQRLAPGHWPSRHHRQGRPARQGHADHPRRRATPDEISAIKAAGLRVSISPPQRAAHRLRHAADLDVARRRHPGRAVGRYGRADRQCRHVRAS